MEKRKKRWGDRSDGTLVRNADTMHVIMPFLMPNRCDNEALLNEFIDLEKVNEFLEKRNAGDVEFKTTFFHVVCAALGLTVAKRPKMNRFYAGQRLYERNEITLTFVVKKQFTDDSSETMAVVTIDPESEQPPIDQVYEQVKKVVYGVRKEGNVVDGATGIAGVLNKLPRFLIRFAMWCLDTLDYHGHYPKAFSKVDPYSCTLFISNLGSIKMNAQYHHLANRGTNSVFVIIGEKKLTPVFAPDGSYEMRELLPVSLTVDERIADGVYFAKTMKVFKEILANPELLTRPVSEELPTEQKA